MKKILKFKTKDQNVWFTSDQHFDHDKPWIVQARGFTNIEDHNQWLIESHNEVVKPDDICFIIGDVSLCSTVERTQYFLNSLNGRLIKLNGNHRSYTDKIYKQTMLEQFGRDDIEVYPLTWNNKVTFVGSQLNVIIDNQFCVLSHFCFRVWEHNHHGSYNLSAHSHSNDKERNPDTGTGRGIDVGVDNFRRPVSFAEIKKIMDSRDIICHDHHRVE